ncbi:MAG: maleylpyruvate isomerase family mycothiol-dependent enzyme [Actinomycetota bacterium]|nr:maleylpyruvate isomerase family mycothiol-dependent enzyme [Actinomycetota bacterium]MDQ3681215.1 maleylpyruvate isomerase family mycothiol-dependent enzyme [Actinomycetota bacterium]
MKITAKDVATIPQLGHREAMALAAAEYDRFVAAVDALTADEWDRPTDNDLWDVKAMVAHVLGMMEMNAGVREMVRQQRAAAKSSKRNRTAMIDELTALQVDKHMHRPIAELTSRVRTTALKALAGRRRTPRFIRALPMDSGTPLFSEKWKLGYLLDVILTRDTWMHRVDLARATGRELALSSDHDGRIVADVVSEWARRHGRPFTLLLLGPAGGEYTQGNGGEDIELDAVEFCRVLSGRGTGPGLLTQSVPF